MRYLEMIRPGFRSFCAKALTVCVTVFFFTPFEDVGASSSSVTMATNVRWDSL